MKTHEKNKKDKKTARNMKKKTHFEKFFNEKKIEKSFCVET